MSENYFIHNRETGKLELHFEKSAYAALTDAQKAEIKGAFLWGRNSGCWISRCKEPNLYYPRRVALSLGLADAGQTGERLSFAEQMERKQERAERRADRYDARADAAEKRGVELQAPINKMHGDIAFFTQPNINTSAGRAFTRRREKMFAAWERGFEEFNKSEYWQGRAAIARRTAAGKELQNKGFLQRRIAERESSIRKLSKRVTEYEGYLPALERGETPRDSNGWEIRLTLEQVHAQLDADLDRLEALLDELGFYQDALAALGGVQFSRDNIKPGYIVRVARWGACKVVSTGPKNITILVSGTPLTAAYADIAEIISATEDAPEAHPFKAGESFTCSRWNSETGKAEKVTFTIIRATDKSVTLKTGEEKPFVRKPVKPAWAERWQIAVTDWSDGTWIKEIPQPAAMTPDEFAAMLDA